MIDWHSCSVSVVAGSGYWMLFVMVVCIDSHTNRRGKCPVRILSAQSLTQCFKNITSSLLFPSGASRTPNVQRALLISNLSGIFVVPVQS
jgi:hypothetical protein